MRWHSPHNDRSGEKNPLVCRLWRKIGWEEERNINTFLLNHAKEKSKDKQRRSKDHLKKRWRSCDERKERGGYRTKERQEIYEKGKKRKERQDGRKERNKERPNWNRIERKMKRKKERKKTEKKRNIQSSLAAILFWVENRLCLYLRNWLPTLHAYHKMRFLFFFPLSVPLLVRS